MVEISGILEKLGWQFLLPTQHLIDFELAAGLAFDVAGGTEDLSEEKKEKLADRYSEFVEQATLWIAEYASLTDLPPTGPVLVFDRQEWVVINLEKLKFFLEPLSKSYWESLLAYTRSAYRGAGKALKKVSAVAVTTELGLLLGYISRRVLAQYDWQLPSPSFTGRLLYFVEPNIKEWEKRLHLRSYRPREWISLHEAAHTLQFSLHPWLEDYIFSLMQEYVGLAEKALSRIEERLSERPAPLTWSWLWWRQLVGSEYQALLARIQAVMSLLEGYSDHMMMEVGKKHLPYDEYIQAVFRRQVGRSLASQVLEHLLGFHLKLRQYELGEHFVSTVIEREGLKFLEQVWEGPDKLPSWQEIHFPEEWMARMS